MDDDRDGINVSFMDGEIDGITVGDVGDNVGKDVGVREYSQLHPIYQASMPSELYQTPLFVMEAQLLSAAKKSLKEEVHPGTHS